MRCLVSTAGLLLFAAGMANAQGSPVSKPLFDGKTLTGWQARSTSAPASTGEWSVEQGAIVCPGTSPGWLSTDATYGDYVLTLEFRGAAGVNSGVFIRSAKEGQPHVTGYEVQIWDNQPAGFNTGSLVGSLKAGPTKMLPDQWNSFEIIAHGEHFRVALNSKTLLDMNDSKHPSPGVIGFQCQKGNRIEFRNIRLIPVGR